MGSFHLAGSFSPFTPTLPLISWGNEAGCGAAVRAERLFFEVQHGRRVSVHGSSSAGLFLPQIVRILQRRARMRNLESFWGEEMLGVSD